MNKLKVFRHKGPNFLLRKRHYVQSIILPPLIKTEPGHLNISPAFSNRQQLIVLSW